MRSRMLRRLIVVVGILALPVVGYAQEATLTGTVTDSTGDLLSGVTVRAGHEASRSSSKAVTDERGRYRIPLRVGAYVLTAELKGFATATKNMAVSDRAFGSVAGLAPVDFSLVPVGARNQPPAAAKAWNPPRTPDGQPDIQGTWNNDRTTGDSINYDLETGHRSPEHYIIQGETPDPHPTHAIVDPADGRIPYQPWAAEKAKEHLDNYQNPTKAEYIAGRVLCHLPGAPGTTTSGGPQILQIPGYVVMLIEFTHAYRVIPLDGRPHVGQDMKLWQGDSRGHWEGNTLVVDVTNQNGKWLDLHGNFHGDAIHVVERWTLADATTLKYEATIEDPTMYAKPWKLAFTFLRNKDKNYELMENACHEGNVAMKARLLRAPR